MMQFKPWIAYLDVFAMASLIVHFKICCNLSSNNVNSFSFFFLPSWSSSPLLSDLSRPSLSTKLNFSLQSSVQFSDSILNTSTHFPKVCAIDIMNFTLDWEFVAPIIINDNNETMKRLKIIRLKFEHFYALSIWSSSNAMVFINISRHSNGRSILKNISNARL